MKINFTSISLLILSISVFFSASLISNSITNYHNDGTTISTTNKNKEDDDIEKQILTKNELANYLGISIEKFDELNEWQNLSFGEGFPYFEDMNGNKYYTIQSIEKWLADNKNYKNELKDF